MKQPTSKRAKGERTFVEITTDTPIIWPKVAWEFLENQVKTQIRDSLTGPETRLWFLVEEAIDNLLVGLREVEPGKEVIIQHQTVPISVTVVDTRGGKPIRRRKLANVPALEIEWPYAI